MNDIAFVALFVSITLTIVMVLIFVGLSKVRKMSLNLSNLRSRAAAEANLGENVRRKVKSLKSKLNRQNNQLTDEFKLMKKIQYGDKVMLVEETD
jgi:uncharacterized protein YlxW (UPF0749 family)